MRIRISAGGVARRALLVVSLASISLVAVGDAGANHEDPTSGLACTPLATPITTGLRLPVLGPGGSDLLWMVESGPGVAQPRPASMIVKHPAWVAATAWTGWIGPQPGTNVDGPVGTWVFSVDFVVNPACSALGSLEFEFAVDNTVTWHLDDPQAPSIGGWTVVSLDGFNQLHTVDHHGITPGLHTLYGVMGNAGGPTGLLVASGPGPLNLLP